MISTTPPVNQMALDTAFGIWCTTSSHTQGKWRSTRCPATLFDSRRPLCVESGVNGTPCVSLIVKTIQRVFLPTPTSSTQCKMTLGIVKDPSMNSHGTVSQLTLTPPVTMLLALQLQGCERLRQTPTDPSIFHFRSLDMVRNLQLAANS